MADGRVPCEGHICERSRASRGADDPWPRWVCPICWRKVRADTKAGICRLRQQLGKAVKRQKHGDAAFITKRLFVVWDQAVGQIRQYRSKAKTLNPTSQDALHVDAGD